MKKLRLIAALFACVFGFAACEKGEEGEEIKSFEYSIVSYPLGRCYDIYVFEKNKNKEIVNSRKIYEMYSSDVETFRVTTEIEYVDLFFQRTDNQGNHYYEKMINEDVYPDCSDIYLGGTKITKEEYEFYTNR